MRKLTALELSLIISMTYSLATRGGEIYTGKPMYMAPMPQTMVR